ncbi:hypothetical protein NPIL_672911 [Nephila pilipes]|uniref:Uncharacterized protein n=1 Tax=Nephila pilipes TaxID=299642 RepID=A0A8X6TT39_NEPPI|nr:hypothetical protein NPIL_672911 [Nephila pilipes]
MVLVGPSFNIDGGIQEKLKFKKKRRLLLGEILVCKVSIAMDVKTIDTATGCSFDHGRQDRRNLVNLSGYEDPDELVRHYRYYFGMSGFQSSCIFPVGSDLWRDFVYIWVWKPSEREMVKMILMRRYVPYPDCRNSKPWSVKGIRMKGVREIFGGFPRKIALKSAA